MHIRMPRRRRARRNALLSYPRSATKVLGRCLGRPRPPATTDANGVERLLSEPDLSHIGAVQMETERETIAVNDKHPLGALPFLGEADLVTTLLGRRERAVKEGDAPIELTLPVEHDEG